MYTKLSFTDETDWYSLITVEQKIGSLIFGLMMKWAIVLFMRFAYIIHYTQWDIRCLSNEPISLSHSVNSQLTSRYIGLDFIELLKS